MIDDVTPKISEAFSKIESYYLKRTRKAYDNLSKQMSKVKQLFVSKYQKIINQRIIDSDKKEKSLQSKIDKLSLQLKEIHSVKVVIGFCTA